MHRRNSVNHPRYAVFPENFLHVRFYFSSCLKSDVTDRLFCQSASSFFDFPMVFSQQQQKRDLRLRILHSPDRPFWSTSCRGLWRGTKPTNSSPSSTSGTVYRRSSRIENWVRVLSFPPLHFPIPDSLKQQKQQ